MRGRILDATVSESVVVVVWSVVVVGWSCGVESYGSGCGSGCGNGGVSENASDEEEAWWRWE